MVRPLNRLMMTVLALSFGATVVSSCVAASPTVISDRGGIEIKELLNPPGESVESVEELTRLHNDPETMKDGLLSAGLYPVYSESLTVGPIGQSEATDIPSYLLTMPFFIVGYDRVSANWMIENLDILVENHAVGLVVNIETPEQMKELMRITQNRVALTPVQGDDLAETLNLRHYPAYIDHQGVVR